MMKMNLSHTARHVLLNLRTLGLLLILVVAAACDTSTPAPTQPPAVTLEIAYAASANAYINQAISSFNAASKTTPAGELVQVNGTALSDGDLVEALAAKEMPYALVIPADRYWIDVGTSLRQQKGNSAIQVKSCTPIATSPVVMITWQSMAETLGWPERNFTWNDIAELALSPSAWQGYDRPEWGTLTFGHAHPILSHSGLAATLGEAYAAGPLTASDVQSDVVKSFVRVVERSVARYASDSQALISTMAARGQRYLHIAIGYESEVINNPSTGTDPLIAIYPTETFVATYNACLIGDNQAAQTFAQYLLDPQGQQIAADTGYRPISTTVNVPKAEDAYASYNLAASYKILPIPSVDIVRNLQTTWESLKRPLNIVLLIDVSGSMDGNKIKAAREGAMAFLNRLSDEDQVTLYAFNDQVQLLVPPTRLGDKRQEILQTVDRLRANGGTALYDALYEARQAIQPTSQRINAIVVLSDGEDRDSLNVSLNQTIDLLQNAKGGVTVYTIGYGEDANESVLARLAEAGNGLVFTGNPDTINQIYLEIASQFGGSRGLGR